MRDYLAIDRKCIWHPFTQMKEWMTEPQIVIERGEGDYLFDILCAKAAGAVSVLLANHHNAKEFSEHADFTIEKIEGILQIVEG